jgi:hypothetical protein
VSATSRTDLPPTPDRDSGPTGAAAHPPGPHEAGIHPAESRGYRELYLTGGQLVQRWSRLAEALSGSAAQEALAKGSAAIDELLSELAPLTARHDLHGGVAAQGGGARIGQARAAVADRFLERNQALRAALHDLEHLTVLLLYLASVSETRGDPELPEFCRSWERRLRRHVGALRKAIVDLGSDPDAAIEPLDESRLGRAAHGVSYGAGALGEWVDRQIARRRS